MSKLQPLNTYVIFEPILTNTFEQSGGIIIPDSIAPTQALGKVVAFPTTSEFCTAYPQLYVGARIFYNIKEIRNMGKYCAVAGKDIIAVEMPE